VVVDYISSFRTDKGDGRWEGREKEREREIEQEGDRGERDTHRALSHIPCVIQIIESLVPRFTLKSMCEMQINSD
jgi:hypothetical protein